MYGILGMTQPTAELPYISGLLEITIHTAAGLVKADIFGKGDPYVVVTVNKNKIYTTSIKHGTVDPTFEESTQCILTDITKSKLSFDLYDKDRIGADDFLGSAFVNLSKKCSIQNAPVPLMLPDRNDCGCLNVTVKFKPLQIIGPVKENTKISS